MFQEVVLTQNTTWEILNLYFIWSDFGSDTPPGRLQEIVLDLTWMVAHLEDLKFYYFWPNDYDQRILLDGWAGL